MILSTKKLAVIGCLLLTLMLGISAETTFASTQHQNNTNCIIPPSGPWPPCATGGSTQPSPATCVIPPSGPWPSCATGGTNPPVTQPTPNPTTPQFTQLTTFNQGDIDPLSIAAHNGKIYFIHLDTNRNRTLWVTDGTTASTKQLARDSFKPVEFAPCGSALIIVSESATWSINQHGWLIKLADKRLSGGFDHNGNCYLWHGQGSIVYPGKHELWRTDGTTQGTAIVHSRFSGGGGFHSFTSAPNGQFVFAHTNNAGSSSTNDIMISDGNSARKITSGWGVAGVTTNAIYVKWYGAKGSCGAGVAHSLDGTRRFSFSANTPAELGTIGHRLLFFAPYPSCYSNTYFLWQSDGTPAGTTRLLQADYAAGIVYNEYAYFARLNTQDRVELWRSNGTAQGTQFVKAIPAAPSIRHLSNFQIVDDKLYFTVGDGDYGITLWQSDGTNQNTKQLTKIWQSDSESEVVFGRNITVTSDGQALYLRANSDNSAPQLWRLALTGTTTSTPSTSCVIPTAGPWPPCAR